jgi:ribonucleoside-diphosphate reductase alpha chain
MRFEPSGWSGNARIGYAKSIMDYLFRWLKMRFLEPESGDLFELLPASSASASDADPATALAKVVQMGDAPLCPNCGSLMAPKRLMLALSDLRQHQRLFIRRRPIFRTD